MRRMLVSALGAVIGLASGVAFASDWEGTSGATNESKKEVDAPSGSALRTILVREQSDKPYLISFGFYKTADGSRSDTKTVKTNEASSVGTYQSGEVDLGTGVYATAIQVCTNKKADDNKERIKGLKLWGATINNDGSLAQNGTPHDYKHANCQEWHKKVSCDSKSVITSVRAYYGDKGFSGIQIGCSRPASSN